MKKPLLLDGAMGTELINRGISLPYFNCLFLDYEEIDPRIAIVKMTVILVE